MIDYRRWIKEKWGGKAPPAPDLGERWIRAGCPSLLTVPGGPPCPFMENGSGYKRYLVFYRSLI